MTSAATPSPPNTSTTLASASRWWIFPLAVWIASRIWTISALYVGAAFWPVQTDFKDVNPHAGTYENLEDYYRNYAQNMPKYGRYPMLGIKPGGRWESLSPFVHWDTLWYLSVVEVGYRADPKLPIQQNVAFFPGFPLAIRAMQSIGLPVIPSAILLSNLATLAAGCLLYRYASRVFGEPSARWTLLLWQFYPMGFFGSVPYADPFLAIGIIGALSAAQQENYRLAGVWGGIATAFRPPAVALAGLFIPVLSSRPWNRDKAVRAFVGLALTGVGVAAYFAYLGYVFGDPLLYLHVSWYDPPKMSGLNPVRWLITLLAGVLNVIKLLTNSDSPPLELYSGRIADPLLYLWALMWLPSIRKLGTGVLLFAMVSFLLPLMTLETVASYGRYIWCIIPVFLVAGNKIGGKESGWVTLVIFAAGQFVLAMWFGGGWVVI
ncbi:MAG: hypothetical protein ACKVT0_02700 [Planctomycetaceae bacterium]